MREAINLIANKYGYELQSRQCIEELSELIQAICKDKRKRTATSNNSEIIKPISKFSETGSHVIEEIADVEIMLEQLKLLMDCSDEVKKVKISKINRQLERIGVKLSQQEKDNNNGWIPVSERFPEKNGLYLVCYENLNCYPSKCLFLNGKFNDTHILVWQPLPEPYRKEKEDE